MVGTELSCELALEVTVVTDEADEVEEVEDTEDDELERWRVLRVGANMLIPLASSALTGPSDCPPLIHPGRLRFEKLGGLATAVIWSEDGSQPVAIQGSQRGNGNGERDAALECCSPLMTRRDGTRVRCPALSEALVC